MNTTPFFATEENLKAAAEAPRDVCMESFHYLAKNLDPGAVQKVIRMAMDGSTTTEICTDIDPHAQNRDLTPEARLGFVLFIEGAVRTFGRKSVN